MTKEQFMQIAEEVGIASSDWKEDLWKLHELLVHGLNPLLVTEESMCRTLLLAEKRRGKQAHLTLLTTGFPESPE